MNKFNLCSVLAILAWLVCLVYVTTMQAAGTEVAAPVAPIDELDMILATVDVDKPAAEPETYEDYVRANGTMVSDCLITHYCCERREHICGTGDGITSTGVEVTPDWTCAVDTSVIPYGAVVMVDYGDRTAFYKAQDCGAWIKGKHIDLAVETHDEALEMGTQTVNVYWIMEEEE